MKNCIHKSRTPLTDLDTWFELAGPKSAHQWKDGRSAKESARAWIDAGGIPPELRSTLESHPDFGTIHTWTAEPEAQVRFDRLRGEPSNLDVLLLIEDEFGPAVVAVEAKADETFGGTLADTLRAADQRLERNSRSKGRLRVEQLTSSLLRRSAEDPELASLRYQLLTASAAAIAEAERRDVDRAVLLVHEFVTDETTDDRHALNRDDLGAFLTLLGATSDTSVDGRLWAAGVVGGAPLFSDSVRLHVGKATVNLRDRHA